MSLVSSREIIKVRPVNLRPAEPYIRPSSTCPPINAFAAFDQFGDGSVSRYDLAEALLLAGYQCGGDDLYLLLLELENEGMVSVNFQEFSSLLEGGRLQ